MPWFHRNFFNYQSHDRKSTTLGFIEVVYRTLHGENKFTKLTKSVSVSLGQSTKEILLTTANIPSVDYISVSSQSSVSMLRRDIKFLASPS